MAMVTHIQTSSPSIPSPITVHIKTLHPFAMREKLGIGADHSFQSAIPQTFFSFTFPLARSRSGSSAVLSPIPRQTLALCCARPPTADHVRFPARSDGYAPILERYALLDVLTLCVLSAVEACADGASRAAIFFRSHSGLSIGMPY